MGNLTWTPIAFGLALPRAPFPSLEVPCSFLSTQSSRSRLVPTRGSQAPPELQKRPQKDWPPAWPPRHLARQSGACKQSACHTPPLGTFSSSTQNVPARPRRRYKAPIHLLPSAAVPVAQASCASTAPHIPARSLRPRSPASAPPAPSAHPPCGSASCQPWSPGLRDAGRPRLPRPPAPPRPLTRSAAGSRRLCRPDRFGEAQAFPGSRGPVRQRIRLPPRPRQTPFPVRLRRPQLRASRPRPRGNPTGAAPRAAPGCLIGRGLFPQQSCSRKWPDDPSLKEGQSPLGQRTLSHREPGGGSWLLKMTTSELKTRLSLVQVTNLSLGANWFG